MRRDDHFVLTNVAGNMLLVSSVGTASYSSNVILLNSMGEELWNLLETEISKDEMIDYIIENYEITDRMKVNEDIENFLNKLRIEGCLLE